VRILRDYTVTPLPSYKCCPLKGDRLLVTTWAIVPLVKHPSVTGVLAKLKVYVIPVVQTYTILLSRRWLRRVSAVEYHTENKLTICGSDGKLREIYPTGQQSVGMPIAASIHTPETIESEYTINDEGADTAMEIILDELDNWIAGNV